MDAQLAGGRPEGVSLELGLLHSLPQSPLASSGYLPFGSNVFALGRQELAEGPVLSPGLRPAVRRPVVRTGVVRGEAPRSLILQLTPTGRKTPLSRPAAGLLTGAPCPAGSRLKPAGAHLPSGQVNQAPHPSACLLDAPTPEQHPGTTPVERGVLVRFRMGIVGTLLSARSHVVNTYAEWSVSPSVATGSAIFTMRPVLVESLAGLVRRSKVRMMPHRRRF